MMPAQLRMGLGRRSRCGEEKEAPRVETTGRSLSNVGGASFNQDRIQNTIKAIARAQVQTRRDSKHLHLAKRLPQLLLAELTDKLHYSEAALSCARRGGSWRQFPFPVFLEPCVQPRSVHPPPLSPDHYLSISRPALTWRVPTTQLPAPAPSTYYSTPSPCPPPDLPNDRHPLASPPRLFRALPAPFHEYNNQHCHPNHLLLTVAMIGCL